MRSYSNGIKDAWKSFACARTSKLTTTNIMKRSDALIYVLTTFNGRNSNKKKWKMLSVFTGIFPCRCQALFWCHGFPLNSHSNHVDKTVSDVCNWNHSFYNPLRTAKFHDISSASLTKYHSNSDNIFELFYSYPGKLWKKRFTHHYGCRY